MEVACLASGTLCTASSLGGTRFPTIATVTKSSAGQHDDADTCSFSFRHPASMSGTYFVWRSVCKPSMKGTKYIRVIGAPDQRQRSAGLFEQLSQPFLERPFRHRPYEYVGEYDLAPPHVEIEWNIDGPCRRAGKQHAVKPRQQRAHASIGATGIVGHTMALQEGNHNRRIGVYR